VAASPNNAEDTLTVTRTVAAPAPDVFAVGSTAPDIHVTLLDDDVPLGLPPAAGASHFEP
jgi:hypothetical protein